MKILITGSAGYIGSCLFEYLKKKYTVFGTDKIIPKIKKQKNFFVCNLLDFKKINDIIKTIKPDIIIHLAAQSTVDFIDKKKEYIKNNTYVTRNIIRSIHKNKTKHFLFSSTAAVYKNSNKKLTEKSQLSPNNIYGKTKLDCEKLIINNINKGTKTNFIIFRFFNVCSSLISLKIGEMHNPETHLIPILSSKFKKNKKVFIYGNNFRTKDKTCVRDYIHIADIVKAFDKGIKYLLKNKKSEIINLGTKKGFSTLSIFKTFKNFYNYKYKEPFFKKRRKGDVDKLICDNKKSYKILKWYPKFSVISKIIDDEKKWVNFIAKKKIIRKTVY
jgi:UDP-glucose 4-epimerase